MLDNDLVRNIYLISILVVVTRSIVNLSDMFWCLPCKVYGCWYENRNLSFDQYPLGMLREIWALRISSRRVIEEIARTYETHAPMENTYTVPYHIEDGDLLCLSFSALQQWWGSPRSCTHSHLHPSVTSWIIHMWHFASLSDIVRPWFPLGFGVRTSKAYPWPT